MRQETEATARRATPGCRRPNAENPYLARTSQALISAWESCLQPSSPARAGAKSGPFRRRYLRDSTAAAIFKLIGATKIVIEVPLNIASWGEIV